MTVRTANFADHLRVLRDHGCVVVPLVDLVSYLLGTLAALPPRSVVLTADDGHRSIYETMAPMLRESGWPVTLFIYPSAISNASYAMRWEHLRALSASGQFSVQSHTYWHPNFLRERRNRTPQDFAHFVETQLRRSKTVLEERLGTPVSLLAWPFGLYDKNLSESVRQAGYRAAFALGSKPCSLQDPVYALPRYLMVDSIDARRLAGLLQEAFTNATTVQ